MRGLRTPADVWFYTIGGRTARLLPAAAACLVLQVRHRNSYLTEAPLVLHDFRLPFLPSPLYKTTCYLSHPLPFSSCGAGFTCAFGSRRGWFASVPLVSRRQEWTRRIAVSAAVAFPATLSFCLALTLDLPLLRTPALRYSQCSGSFPNLVAASIRVLPRSPPGRRRQTLNDGAGQRRRTRPSLPFVPSASSRAACAPRCPTAILLDRTRAFCRAVYQRLCLDFALHTRHICYAY